ncbi:hypothetical protein ICM05_01425 [Leucobacter sp. cx-42]|nr:hypothetical protein [Leucobacter sp. cx-42]
MPYINLAQHLIGQQRNPEARRLTSTIIVGYQEQHEVTYDLNYWESIERVYVDRTLVVTKPMRTHYVQVHVLELMVGVHEKHHVRYEYDREVWNYKNCPIYLRVYVDGYLIETKEV